jgi:hypothetical protein
LSRLLEKESLDNMRCREETGFSRLTPAKKKKKGNVALLSTTYEYRSRGTKWAKEKKVESNE